MRFIGKLISFFMRRRPLRRALESMSPAQKEAARRALGEALDRTTEHFEKKKK